MATSNVTIGCASLTQSFYYHNSTQRVPFANFGTSISNVLTNTYQGACCDFYQYGNPGSTITNFEPGSAYQITTNAPITVTQTDTFISPTNQFVGQTIMFVKPDTNSKTITIATDLAADLSKISVIWKLSNNCSSGPYFSYGYYQPGSPSNTFTTIDPGIPYLFIVKTPFTINIPRKNQYIITHPANNPPSAFIKTQSGNYLITQQGG
jgi:hypothetical protein